MKRCGLVWIVGLIGSLVAPLASQEKKPAVVVDKDAKTVTVDVKMAPRNVRKEKIYPLEVIATWPYPKGQKAHETIVIIDEAIKPSDIAKALESLGLKPGTPVKGEGEPKGPALNLYFLVPDPTGLDRKVPLERAMVDSNNGKPFPKNVETRFTGSLMVQPDPNKAEKVYGADVSGTLMSIFPVTAETVFQTSLLIQQEGVMKLEVNTKSMPKEGTPIKMVFEVKK